MTIALDLQEGGPVRGVLKKFEIRADPSKIRLEPPARLELSLVLDADIDGEGKPSDSYFVLLHVYDTENNRVTHDLTGTFMSGVFGTTKETALENYKRYKKCLESGDYELTCSVAGKISLKLLDEPEIVK